MRSSRGMGAIRPELIRRKDANVPVKVYAEGGEVWDKPRPEKLGKPKPLSPKRKASAKAAAKAAGRPYPNLIDNMRAAKG